MDSTSCEKADVIDFYPVQESNPLSNQMLNTFAKTFSFALNDEAIKDFVIDRCKKRENGDYEFLYVLAKDQTLSTGISLKHRLAQLDPDHDLSFYDRDIFETAPLLTIYLYFPVNYSKREIEGIESYARVYAATVKDDTNKEEKIPYYIYGNIVETRSGDVPSEPMLVIKQNERVEIRAQGSEIGEFEKLIGKANGLDFVNVFAGEAIPFSEYDEYKMDMSLRGFQRDLYPWHWDVVQRVKFADALEGWFGGGPELRINCLRVGDTSPITKPYGLQANQKNEWVLLNAAFFIWSIDKPMIGDRVKYHFSESDGGNPFKFKVGLAAEVKIAGIFVLKPSIEFQFGDDKDDLYGESLEYYSSWVSPDSWGNQHQAGGDFWFWANVKP